MTTETPTQPEEEPSPQPVESTLHATTPPDGEHTQHSAQKEDRRAWYAALSEDWLATIAGLVLVVLLVFRVLRAIP